jgi:hypothetical protein
VPHIIEYILCYILDPAKLSLAENAAYVETEVDVAC